MNHSVVSSTLSHQEKLLRRGEHQQTAPAGKAGGLISKDSEGGSARTLINGLGRPPRSARLHLFHSAALTVVL